MRKKLSALIKDEIKIMDNKIIANLAKAVYIFFISKSSIKYLANLCCKVCYQSTKLFNKENIEIYARIFS